jgi:hypothetical protein
MYPAGNSMLESQDSNDMHNSKTSVANDHQEDSGSNEINEETSRPASSIDMAEQQASSSVSANKIDGHVFDDDKETDIAIKKIIFVISDKPSKCVAEWVDAESVPFVCSVLYLVVQNNRQNKIRYTFDISNCDEIFDILVLDKRIRIHVYCDISSSKELGKCAYCKWHDSFSHNTCGCNVFCRQLQSAIDESRLKFRDHLNTEGHMSRSQILPKGVIKLEGKKILVRSLQAETTKGKNVIFGESRQKMKQTIKKLKSTVDEPSAKYKKGNTHTKIDKTKMSERSNQSFWFFHIRPIFSYCST